MDSPDRFGFAHRANTDGSIDSICRLCFATIATAQWAQELAARERDHVCDPWVLERYREVALEGLEFRSISGEVLRIHAQQS